MYQAAQMAGVTRQAIYDAVRRKSLPSEVREVTVKVRRIKVADLLDYMRRTGGRRGRGASKKSAPRVGGQPPAGRVGRASSPPYMVALSPQS